jgi:hypothetical protein
MLPIRNHLLEDEEMNIQARLFRMLVAVCFGLVLFVHADAADKPKTAHAAIPFDFWIADTKLPAGDYEMRHVTSPTLVVFTSPGDKRSTEAFMLPLNDDPVQENQAKLVFLVQNGQHYLYEAWGVYGKRIVTAQYGIPAPTGDMRAEVPVVYQ